MEAMSVGATCVGPNIGGISEMLESGDAGYLYEPTCHTALSDVLINLVTNKKIINPYVLINKSHEKFSAAKAGRTIANLIAEIRTSEQ